MSLKTMSKSSVYRVTTFHCAPVSAFFPTKFDELRACGCSGGCSPSACCFPAKLLQSCTAKYWDAIFHCAPFSANSFTKLLRAFWCSGGCSPSACCFALKSSQLCTAGHWDAIFHCAPFSVNSLAELVGAGCCGGGGSPPCCAWAAGTLFLLLFTRRVPRVCFFCRATVPAEHSARFVFVLVAGLTELIACCALALQNPP